MKKLLGKSLLISVLTALCMFFAQSASAATAITIFEQPRIPESLIIED